MPTATRSQADRDAENLERFKKRVAALKHEFDEEIARILEDIRAERMKEIKDKIHA